MSCYVSKYVNSNVLTSPSKKKIQTNRQTDRKMISRSGKNSNTFIRLHAKFSEVVCDMFCQIYLF